MTNNRVTGTASDMTGAIEQQRPGKGQEMLIVCLLPVVRHLQERKPDISNVIRGSMTFRYTHN